MRLFGYLVLVLSTTLVLTSQLGAKVEAFQALEFNCVTWDRLPRASLYYKNGTAYEPLKIGYKSRTSVVNLKAGVPVLEIYSKQLLDGGQEEFSLVGSAANVKGTNRVLFLIQLMSKPNQTLRLGGLGIDDSFDDFPIGSFRFINATQQPLKLVMGKERGQVAVRGMTVVKPNIPDLGGFVPVYIGDSKGDVLFESRFYAQPRGRKLVIVRPADELGGPVRLRFLSEIVPVASDSDGGLVQGNVGDSPR